MKEIKISKEEILEAFNKTAIIEDKLHKNLVEKGIARVDPKNDVEIKLDGEIYWATTEFEIRPFNNVGEFRIYVLFEIKKGSKYGKALYEFERDI